jgi:hypothetical protein
MRSFEPFEVAACAAQLKLIIGLVTAIDALHHGYQTASLARHDARSA